MTGSPEPIEPSLRGEVTALLVAWSQGEPDAPDRLLELVYAELRSIAARYFQRERVGSTLQATGLVHEAYLRLVDQTRVEWKNRDHFLAVASQAMRRILVDHARARGARKRGRGLERISLSIDIAQETPVDPLDALALDRALEALAANDPALARLVELRYFGGLTLEETASVMGRSPAALKRDWRVARAFLHRELGLLGAPP